VMTSTERLLDEVAPGLPGRAQDKDVHARPRRVANSGVNLRKVAVAVTSVGVPVGV
jgi:hypothetical protein